MAKIFSIVYSRGPNWLGDKSVFEQPLKAHGAYMHDLFKAGKLMHGGPFLDNQGGLAIIRVEEEAEAQRIVADDPAVVQGIMNAALHPWYQVDWETYNP